MSIDGVQANTPEEKVRTILNVLNGELTTNEYKIKLFDPFTTAEGTKTHSAKVTLNTVELRQKTTENDRSFKSHKNTFFHSIYVKNDETKLARNENYRLRKKARKLRAKFPDATIKIEKGVLKQNGAIVDKFDINNQIFQ